MKNKFIVNSNIEQAYTLPARFYQDETVYQNVKEKVLLPSWQLVATTDDLPKNGSLYPFTLLEGSLDEPLLLTRDNNGIIHCLSNVCTHRGKVLVEAPMKKNGISCGYHGRCFHLDGRFKSMPEFKETLNFPTAEDHLPKVEFATWGKFIFASLQPKVPFDTYIEAMKKRLAWFPLDDLIYDAPSSQTYQVNANWALYCDNYLEGFHVPFIHNRLNQALDFGNYTTETFRYCNLQFALAKKGENCFELPPESPDYGQRVFAYYFWLFPNMMFNFYPWGLSLNIVEPLGINQTRIIFKTYLLKGKTAADALDTHIHETEMEDEAVVESVQKGVSSRLYHRGRFSATQEKGVHHFHTLLADFLNKT